MVVKWRFDDPFDSSFAEFEVNPNEGGTPALRKNITSTSTLAPGGKTIIFEGAREATDIQFSGVILTESQLETVTEWFNKSHQVQLTDDLGRVYMIYIYSFEATRERARSHPFKHRYTVQAKILTWPAATP
jgi:hypothetical protein